MMAPPDDIRNGGRLDPAARWRQQTVPPDLLQELRRRAEVARTARTSGWQSPWLPVVAALALLMVAFAVHDMAPRPVLRVELRTARLHMIWFQPINGETVR